VVSLRSWGGQTRSHIYTIEAVNVPKTTAAGTFNTLRVRRDIGSVDIIWIDIDKGIEVFAGRSIFVDQEAGIFLLPEKRLNLVIAIEISCRNRKAEVAKNIGHEVPTYCRSETSRHQPQ